MSDDLNRRQALALLDSAERQIAAARALLGGETAPTPSREQVMGERGAGGADGTCPACREKAPKVASSGFGSDIRQLCGACGYEYPTT